VREGPGDGVSPPLPLGEGPGEGVYSLSPWERAGVRAILVARQRQNALHWRHTHKHRPVGQQTRDDGERP